MSTENNGNGEGKRPSAQQPAGGGKREAAPRPAVSPEIPAEVLQQLREDAVKQAREELEAELPNIVSVIRTEVTAELQGKEAVALEGGGGKIRKVDVRASSLAQSQQVKAEQRALLAAPEGSELPEGYVRCVPLKTFHIDGRDIHGASVEAISVEVFPDPNARPIMLRKSLAHSLRGQGLLQII